MKLTLPRPELKEALAGLSKVAIPRANLPILSHVRLEAEGQTVRLTGTDLSQVVVYETARPLRSMFARTKSNWSEAYPARRSADAWTCPTRRTGPCCPLAPL